MRSVTVLAPAKLNLTLDVTGTRPDGYHTLDMIMQAVSLRERVTLRRSRGLSLSLPGSRVPANEHNTAYKAALAFFHGTGLLAGAAITGEKHVPVRAGMAGGRADYTQGIALHASGVFGLHMVTVGSYEGESFTVQRDGSYKRLVTADGVLKGVIMVGDVSRAGIYTDLIRKKKPLSEIDFDLIRESPQLMAFSQKDRRVQLGGEV